MFRFTVSAISFFFLLLFLSSQVDSKEIRHSELSEPLVTDVVILLPDTEKDPQIFIEMADNLIYIKKSEPFSPKLLEDSIQALRLSRKFSRIDVDSRETPEGILLIFSLTPFRYIKDIRFSGAYPVFEQTILSAITIYTGDAFVPDDLARQKTLIKNLYIDEGFFAPEVNVIIEKDPEDRNVVLIFDINKGEYLRLNQIRFTGNQSFSTGRLSLKMKTRQNSILPRLTLTSPSLP